MSVWVELAELGVTHQIYLETSASSNMFFKSDIWKPYHSEEFRCQAIHGLQIETSLEFNNLGVVVS